VITEKLIKAYIVKGWFKESVIALGSLKTMIEDDLNSTVSDTVSLWALAAKTFLRGERYKEYVLGR